MRSRAIIGVLQDLASAVRGLLRAPGFSLVVVATSAIGIGAAVSIFSVVNTMILRPLPFEDGERLVRLRDIVSRVGAEPRVYNNAPRNVLAIREAGTFAGVAGQEFRRWNLTHPGEPTRVVGIGVSAGWNDVIGVVPVIGRAFTAREERLGLDAGVCLLAHETWQRRFGGATKAVGQQVVLNGRVLTVVGVMPPRFDYPYGADLWFPQPLQEDARGRFVNGVARLRTDQSIAAAQERLDELAERLAEEHPDTNAGIGLRAIPIRDNLLGNRDQVAKALLVAVLLLLVLACVSVADLVLVRVLSRQKELAVRSAVGSSRLRQVWQLAAEGLVLAGIGGAIGLLMAWSITPFLSRMTLEEGESLSAFFRYVTIDHRVFLFAAIATVMTGTIATGLPPALLYRPDPASLLRSGRRSTGGREGRWAAVMVVLQVAVALMLLAGAGLMLRHLSHLAGRDIGYSTDERFVVQLVLPRHRFDGAQERIGFIDEVLERVRALPGVGSAGMSHHIPAWGGSQAGPYTVEDGPVSTPDRYLLANLRYVTDGYLETLDLPVLRGRTFTHEEATESRAVVVVSKSFAERAWPNVDPIGRRVRQGTTAQEREWLDVIGVVGNIEETHDVEDTWYLPYPLAAPSEIYLVVHAEGAGTGLGRGAVRAAIREIDPQQPLDWVRGLHELHVGSYGHHRTGSVLMTFFAVFGLLVAGLGIYGVVAANLARRRRELAVRLALGATPGHVVWLVLRRGLALMLAGLLVGGVAALGLVRVLVRVLSSVRADVPLDFQIIQRLGGDDYVVCAVAALVVAAIAFGASLVPAARASRIEPARLLRE